MADKDSKTLSQDTAFDLLSNGRRRRILQRLQGTDGVELGTLATEISAMENDIPPEELSSKQRKRTYVSLYQTHVPKLEDAGVVEFDSDSGVVSPTEHVDELTGYFSSEPNSVPWELLYFLFAVAGLVVFLITSQLAGVFHTPTYIGIATLIGIMGLAVIQYISTEKPVRAS